MPLLFALILPSAVWAKVDLDVKAGFEGAFRPGRWSPVFISVRSDTPLQAMVELRVANASSSVMEMQQDIGISTGRRTYVLYAPLSILNDPVRVTLRDRADGKIIARWPDSDDIGLSPQFGYGGQQIGFMAVVSGQPAMQGYRRGQARGDSLITQQPQSMLPVSSIGYDGADVVMLNKPDWSQLATDQQRAILAWVRGGGTLIFWPGVESMPSDSPIVRALPAGIGALVETKIDEAKLKSLGLPKRFGSMGVRTLTPNAGTHPVPILNGVANVMVGREGLGQIAVMPLDASTLQFNDSEKFKAFWDKLITDIWVAGAKDAGAASTKLGQNAGNSNTNYDYDFYNVGTAAHAALQRIGDIPNTGAFGFSYIAVLIGAMMLIVGPIDYLVLKKIGHQPWTWATTAGWIGLVTVGALYAGHAMRSGDLHFRTLRIIDQADGALVGEDEIALIYAPRSANYAIESEPTMWWQPVPSGNRYREDTYTLPLRAHQTYRGNVPEPMWIDIWAWKFLQAQRTIEGPGMISAKLSVGDKNITGEVTNNSDRVLTDLKLQTKSGMLQLAHKLDAGATMKVDIGLPRGMTRVDGMHNRYPYSKESEPVVIEGAGQGAVRVSKGLPPDRNAPPPAAYDPVFELNNPRKHVVERAVERGSIVIYASITDPVANVTMTADKVTQRHTALLRAVIEPIP